MHEIGLPKSQKVREIWRIVAWAYREKNKETPQAIACLDAATAAVLKAFPDLSVQEAKFHVVHGYAYASMHHSDWMRKGVPRWQYIWPPTEKGAGPLRT